MDAFIGCSLTPASIWANFEHFWQFFDQDMPFSVSPFFTDWLKTQITPHFVTFYWPTTPYIASMRILAAEVVHDWPGLFMSHLVIKSLYFDPNPRTEGRWKVPILPVLATCLVPSSVHVKPIFEAQQSDTGQRLCTHTHKAYYGRTWLFSWKKSIIFLPTRGGGPEKGPAHGHLGTINPKISSIKQPSRQAFKTRR